MERDNSFDDLQLEQSNLVILAGLAIVVGLPILIHRIFDFLTDRSKNKSNNKEILTHN